MDKNIELEARGVRSINYGYKINAADLSCGVFTVFISATWAIIIQNPLLFQKFCKKLANSDVTKEALNCTASLVFSAVDGIDEALSFIL